MTRQRQLEYQLELKRQQNANASISKLPPEIFVAVFKIIKAENRLEDFHKVLQVCHYWRFMAIDAPFLWTDPPAELHHYTLLMLERSKMALLTVRMPPGTRMATVKAILEHSGRIRSLSCMLNTRSLDTMQKLLSTLPRMPLEELRIAPPYHASKTFKLDSTALCPPDHLRRLILTTIDLDWNLIRVSSLRELQLNFICLSTSVTWDQLFGLLCNTPFLESLFMTLESILINQPSPGARGKPILLQHLQLLSLQYATEDQIQHLLSHMACPHLCDLRIGCNSSEADSNDYDEIIQAISNILNAGNFGSGLNAVEICDNGSFSFELFIGDSPGSATSPFIQLQLPYGEDRNADMCIFSKVLTSLDILIAPDGTSSVAQLSLGVPFGAEELVELFGSLPRLRTIIASEDLVPEIVLSLKIAPNHPTQRAIPFPKLESMTLCILDAEFEDGLWDTLGDVLTQRCTHGAKIQELVLEGVTSVDIPELVTRFSAMATNVVVSDLQAATP